MLHAYVGRFDVTRNLEIFLFKRGLTIRQAAPSGASRTRMRARVSSQRRLMVSPRRPMTPPTLSVGTTSRNTFVPGHRGLASESPSPFFSASTAVIGAGCCSGGTAQAGAGNGIGGGGGSSAAGRFGSRSASESEEDVNHGSTSSGSSSSSSKSISASSSSSSSHGRGGEGGSMAEWGFEDAAERGECEQSNRFWGFSGWVGRWVWTRNNLLLVHSVT